MELRFISWNVNGLRSLRDQIRLLDELDWDVLALLEVTSRNCAELRELAESYAYSLDLRPAGPGEGRKRQMGCALFARHGFRIEDAALLPGAPLPERELIARVVHPDGEFVAGNFSLPPGVGWGPLKGETALAITSWLAARAGPVLFGIDANAPKLDHPELSQSHWWWAEEAQLLGTIRRHDLRDCYREWLEQRQPGTLERVMRLRPQGPLAVSYVRGDGSFSSACRYDMIWASPEFSIQSCQYLFEEAIGAGSDHALVLADLELH